MVAPAPASCPKCGALRRGERACPRCGLAAERMPAYAKAQDAAVPEAVAAAWERVIEAWDDAGRHDALLRLIARHGAYAWAAARYRDAKRAAPASPSPFRSYPDQAVDAIADRQLDRMRRAAEATLHAGASAREDRGRSPYRAATAVLAMLIVAIVAGLVFAAAVQGHRPAGGGAGAVPASPAAAPAQPAGPAQPAPRK